jgi:hypothetical protein
MEERKKERNFPLHLLGRFVYCYADACVQRLDIFPDLES